MKCDSCGSTGVVLSDKKMIPCTDCTAGWQKLCFGLSFQPKSEEPLDINDNDTRILRHLRVALWSKH